MDVFTPQPWPAQVARQIAIDTRDIHSQVYADRYLELLHAPAGSSLYSHIPGFQISIQMKSPELGPYACLVFHDPIPTPLTIAELQEQFTTSYTDAAMTQVLLILPL